ncbi:MAG: alpha/beta hydrolase [Myxococcales bacterium]|nr:alpha/beta hydrolase [Myxococcales bacterium]
MILAHELHRSTTGADRWMLFLHGILGRRANWRSLARRWLERRPGWGAVLVDLREHGESQGFSGPQTVAAAAADLLPLVATVEAEEGGRVAGVLGHSFGGKVAIAGAAALRSADRALEELWVLDAPPGPRDDPREGLTTEVFAVLRRLGSDYRSRVAFTEAVVAAGLSKPLAQWLATSAAEVPAGSGSWRFGLDLDKLQELIDDFSRVDLWPALEAEIAGGTAVGLILGGRSQAVSGADRVRAEALAGQGTLALSVIAAAGHWLHTDAPAEILEILAEPPK